MPEALAGDATQNLVPVRIPGTTQMVWVPPEYVDQAEVTVRQMGKQPNQGGGGAGMLGTVADLGQAAVDFFAQDQIARQVQDAHDARARVLQARRVFYKTLPLAQQAPFRDWQEAQDELDTAQTSATESSLTALRVDALASAGRGLGRVFANSGGGYGGMGGPGTSWGPALLAGAAGFGLAAIFTDNRGRRTTTPVDSWDGSGINP